MKYFLITLFSLLFLQNCSKTVQTQLTESVLEEVYISQEGEKRSLKDILSEHKGHQIVIDVWASWCRDCIIGFPKLKALQIEKPKAVYLFLSADKNTDVWKRAIEKYSIEGEHYFMPEGTKGRLGQFVDIDWIPRYMIVDSNGNIELFEAIVADDPLIRNTLN